MIVCEARLKGFSVGDLLEKIKTKYPLMPVILYSSDSRALKAPSRSRTIPDCTMQKPFTIEELQKVIHEIGRQQL